MGRAVDLTMLTGYNELIVELEKMFEIKGELSPRNQWAIIFTYDEWDMMLLGADTCTYVYFLLFTFNLAI